MTKELKPRIKHIKVVARSELFTIEQVELEFSNGQQRVYERMQPNRRDAVMIIPIIKNELLLVREYAVGTESYELGFPKGVVEDNESVLHAANRELMEEISYGANKLTALSQLTMAPSYFSTNITIVVAEDLYPQMLEGDEPEPLTLVRWPLDKMMLLINDIDFKEARNVAALYLVRDYLNGSFIKR